MVRKIQFIYAQTIKRNKIPGITHVWYTGVIEHATKTDYSAFGIRPDHPAVVKGNAGSPTLSKTIMMWIRSAEDVPNR
jgi:hypothetical protein